ncbi:MAG TPA: hypothetical protein VM733_20135 [Thermoanaerobaculia bacterium]|nr:hypothetical protein [Thermoanaerobaculia bacterium]
MITRWTSILVLACALLACNNDKPANTSAGAAADAPQVATQQQDLTPEQLGEIGARISKNAAQAKQILSEHGLDEKSFEQKIRKVTEDPEASRRYAAAFEKTKAQA